MPQPPAKPQPPQDEWGTAGRQGYEDRPVYQPRREPPKRKGSRVLRTIGGLLVVGGILWATYVGTSSPDGWRDLLKPGLPARPVLVLAVGLLVLLLEKLIR